MSGALWSVVISGVGVLVSLGGSVFVAGVWSGSFKTRLEVLERAQGTLATREQLAGVKEDVAEIKGMFRMTLREPLG